MIKVVLVDDQQLVLEGLRTLLERADDITVAGEAGDGAIALTVIKAQLPDIVLMDIRMPGVDGIEATRRIVADPDLPGVAVIVLTTFDTDTHILEAVRAGAAGFLLKDTSPEQLREAVRIVASGEALLSPAVTRRVMRAAAATRELPDADQLNNLTAREREVLAKIGHGYSNAEIANSLFMSPATARTHVGHVLSKLGARDRAQLVRLAYETGLISPGT